MTPRNRRLSRALALACVCAVASGGCDAPQDSAPAELNLEVLALSGGSCGDTESPTPNADPFDDIEKLTIKISGEDAEGKYGKLVQETQAVANGQTTVVISDVPETLPGNVHRLELFTKGKTTTWYASDPAVIVERNTTNTVDLLLAPHGGFGCIPTDTNFPNVVFPAITELGDGRVLITGGYTGLVTEPITLKQSLSGATDRAFIWDPVRGTLAETFNPMPDGRAAHSAVFVPGAGLGKVLLIGGADSLSVDLSASFPFELTLAKAHNDYVIFDVQTGKFTAGKGKLELKRAFPRAHLMADNTVVITGGGQWPNPDGEYDLVEVFDMELEETNANGGLLSTFGFATSWLRTGHSLTFIRKIEQGLSTLLVWGGTNETNDADDVASVLIQSNTQKSGDNGTFAKVDVYGEWPPWTYFHEMTRLSDNRFVLTGGSRSTGTRLEAPADDEAWLITYNYNTETAKHDVLVEKIPGPLGPKPDEEPLLVGRVFHTSLTGDGENVAILGGMGANHAAITNDPIWFLNPETRVWSVASDGASFAPRAWHGAVTHPSGATLLVGGEASLTDLDASNAKRAYLELYTPSNIPQP
jgi:hypothetical protein